MLSRCEAGDYRILTLNGRNVDRPIPRRVVELVEMHLKRPSIRSYLDYCGELLQHVARCRYFFHETVNPFMPIFTINADLDVYDRTFVREYYSGDDQWAVKHSLFLGLKNLVLHVCCFVLKLPVDEANVTFFLYESVRDDLHELETSKKFKLGLRLVVKFETIVFEDRTVVDSFLKVLNIYRPLFLHRLDDDPFDCAIYGRPHHDVRLPLNMKPDGSKALLPVLFECHRHNFLQALRMTSSLVHVRNETTVMRS